MNQQELLDEARRRFPEGTRFRPVQVSGKLSASVYTSKREPRIYIDRDGEVWVIDTANLYSNRNRVWAEVCHKDKVETYKIF